MQNNVPQRSQEKARYLARRKKGGEEMLRHIQFSTYIKDKELKTDRKLDIAAITRVWIQEKGGCEEERNVAKENNDKNKPFLGEKFEEFGIPSIN
jgi:hypothetical protein